MSGRWRASTWRIVGLLVAATAVGAIVHAVPILVNLHGLLVASAALWIAISATDLERVLGMACYLTMCEVFWRLPGTKIPWFGGPYLALAVVLLGWFRLVRGRLDRLALCYLLCLIPGAAVTFASRDISDARDALVFNLLGGVVLALFFGFCSRLKAIPLDLNRLCWWILAAALHLGGAAAASLVGAATFSFTAESNLVASGGFGPNQVSLALSAGMLAAIQLLFDPERVRRVMAALGATVLAVVAVLTLSRTGPYVAATALVVMLVFRSSTAAQAVHRLARGAVVLLLLIAVVGPRLDDLTGGAASARFSTTTTSHRDELAAGDIEVFRRNFVFGVGVGESPTERARLGYLGSAAHTEQTRLLAEHGIGGLAALLLLGAMVVRSFRRQATRAGRAWCAAWVTWGMGGMLVSASRVSMVAVAFGLAALRVVDSDTRVERPGRTAEMEPQLVSPS